MSLGELIKYYQNQLNTAWTGAFGNAKEPTRAPSLCRPPRLNGMHVIQAADPGTNEARYVCAGIHESPRKFLPEHFKKYGKDNISWCVDASTSINFGPDDYRVYYVLSPATAELNKGAEAQHLDDHRIAYESTLGLLEKLLKGIQMQRVPALPVPEKIIVVKMLESEMRAQRVVSPKVFRYAQMGLDLNLWKAKYAELVKKSQQRDVQGWHTWELRYIPTEEFNQKWKHTKTYYLNGSKPSTGIPRYIEVMRGNSFNLAPTFDQIPG